MKTKAIGISIIIIGIIMTIYTGFNLETTEKVVDLGPLQINKKENHPMQWKPIVGMFIVAVGAVIIIKADKSKNQ